jgi:hypothetical protein
VASVAVGVCLRFPVSPGQAIGGTVNHLNMRQPAILTEDSMVIRGYEEMAGAGPRSTVRAHRL